MQYEKEIILSEYKNLPPRKKWEQYSFRGAVPTGLLSIPLPLCLYCGGKDGILIKSMDRLKIK